MADSVIRNEEPASKRRKKTGFSCCVADCTGKHSDGISLHKFPSESNARRQWIRFVQVCRADFGPAYGTPNNNSMICERHFTSDAYDLSYQLKQSLGIECKGKRLLEGAVPSIQKHSLSNGRSQPIQVNRSPSASASVITTMASTSATCTVTAATSRPTTSYLLPGVPKQRGGYAKRERQRILGDMMSTPERDDNQLPVDSLQEANADMTESTHVECHTQTEPEQMKVHKQNKQVQVHPGSGMHRRFCERHTGVQCKPQVNHAYTQCNLDLDTSYSQSPKSDAGELCEEEDVEVDVSGELHDVWDDDYHPGTDPELSSDELSDQEEQTPATCRKFLVFEDELLQLFQNCPKCAAPCLASIKRFNGSFVQILQQCLGQHCGKSRTWSSQPIIRFNLPAGNLLISAGILFSGGIPSKILQFMAHINMATISDDTFFDHQAAYLQPMVDAMWCRFQDHYINFMVQDGAPLVLGGDGRADSVGHSAKYGTYTTVDLRAMKVVDIQLVQSNEVGGSPKMELKGLQQSCRFFEDQGLHIAQLVTDRAPSVIKYIREQMPNTMHRYDVWHVVKGLKKKMLRLSNEKECGLLSSWIRSICNHLYWVAVSTPDGDGDLMESKWLSLTNHIHDVHEHPSHLFPQCQHPHLPEGGRQKKWLTPGTKLSVKLGEVLESRQMLKDVRKLSTGPQTSAIEAYHSVVNHFAPKMIGFHHHGMLCRAQLAALHFNENHEREQATTRDGTARFNLSYRKSKKGFTLQEVKVGCTYEYVAELLDNVLDMASRFSISEVKAYLKAKEEHQAPPPLCSDFENVRPEKAQAIEQYKARFKLMTELDMVSQPCIQYPYDMVWTVNKERNNPWIPKPNV